ncbi:MAG: AMP-binding protein [Bacteroidetes bacterium]|nr:AMP-binding protein [Bacteroidota bacterium]MBU1114872.1 AMP-binding protein [Bacteroidota bacterium]MBU1799838.1 AMP-binding protein [Bacteroidota bacterium]
MIDFSTLHGETLWERWQYFAQTMPEKEAIIHWRAANEPIRWTYASLLETANKFSHYLKNIGVKKGDVCAIIIRHNPNFYPLYLGIVGIGALPSVLAYPNPRLHPVKFRQGLTGMAQRSGLDWIFTETALEEIILPFVEDNDTTVNELFFPLEWDLDKNINQETIQELSELRAEIKSDEPMLLQHSSGTTGIQKPVVLSHDAILKHVKNYGKSIQISEDDKVVSWLPLYHDMGLIAAFHVPLASGVTSIQIDPFEWVLAPILMFMAASEEKATLGWLPNFAYNLMADKLSDEEMEDLSLGSFRMMINCSEPVRTESHKKFFERFKQYGFKENALGAMYAMAETTLTVTQTVPNKRAAEVSVDREQLSNGKVVITDNESKLRICVSSGKIIDECEVNIVDDYRNVVDKSGVGEIAVKSVSMFSGYRNYPEKTAEVLDENGWYYTGDIGFIYNDELYVIGRKKDIIIVAGNNIYPEDVEDIVSKVENVIPGRVISFGEDDQELGTEQVSVVAETSVVSEEDLVYLRIAIIRAGMGINVNIHKVYLVPPRWLIKSSSGKPSRKANKTRILNKNDEQVWSIK